MHSVNGLFKLLKDCNDEVFVIGGGRIYQMLMPFAEKIYVTWVYRSFPEADTHFPTIDMSEFALVHQDERAMDEPSGLEYAYAEYVRKFRI